MVVEAPGSQQGRRSARSGEPGRPRCDTLVPMSAADHTPEALRTRREPPRFRLARLQRVARLSPHLVRLTLGGPELEGLRVEEPAASVRLLLPTPGTDVLVLPTWNGNEFLLDDGRRPTIRTLTPGRIDDLAHELDLDVVIHPGGAMSAWVEGAAPGAEAAVSGPGRGYAIDQGAPAFLLAGDETALPAIGQLLESLPATAPVQVHLEVAHPDARLDLPYHPRGTVAWCDLPPGAPPGEALVAAVRAADIAPGTHVWGAGEAAAMQQIRRHLFEERMLTRDQTNVRGYWKRPRGAGA